MASRAWRRSRWKYCAAVDAVRDPDVLLRGELEEALEPRARVLGAVALVAVRQQQRQARRLPPLREAGDEELVDDDLGAVDEVAELGFPQNERVRRRDRVAVLEAEARVLRKRRVVDLERGAWRRAGAGAARTSRRCAASCRTACRCENVPRSVSWPVSRIGMPSVSRLANASASAWPQSIPPSRIASRRLSSCRRSFAFASKSSGSASSCSFSASSRSAETAVTTAPPVSAGIFPSLVRRGSAIDAFSARARCAARYVSSNSASASSAVTTPSSTSRAA